MTKKTVTARKTNKEKPEFIRAIQDFVRSMQSMEFAFPFAVGAIRSASDSELKELMNNWIEVGTTPDELIRIGETFLDMASGKNGTKGEFHISDGEGFMKYLDGFLKMKKAKELVSRSFIITLESQIDLFVGELVRNLAGIRPDILKYHGRQVRLGEIIESGGIDNFKRNILEDEIDVLSRKGHAAQVEWIQKQLEIDILDNIPNRHEIIEIVERRNLYTHSDGKITKQYIDALRKCGKKIEEDIKIGKR